VRLKFQQVIFSVRNVEEMISEQNLIEEYKSLRSEIEHNEGSVNILFVANVTATASLIGYGLSKDNPFIFLAPFSVIIPSVYFVARKLRSTTRIGSYIRVILEPRLGLAWQTSWLLLRKKGINPKPPWVLLSISVLYAALSLLCAVLFLAYSNLSVVREIAILFLVLAVLGYGIVALVRSRSQATRASYDDAWKSLDEGGIPNIGVKRTG